VSPAVQPEAAALPAHLVGELHAVRAALRAAMAVVQGLVHDRHLSEAHAGQVCRVAQLADAPLQRLADALALQPQGEAAADGPALDAAVLGSELSELADTADGLGAAFELIAESCSSGDARRKARAVRLAYTMAATADDLATALSEAAARVADEGRAAR